MRKIAATGIAAAASLAIVAGATAPASAALNDRSLAAVLTADGNKFDNNWHDYDIVTEAVLAVLATVLLRKTPLGEYILAVGGNEEAARVSGVPIERTKVITYMISGGLAALAAIILIARLGAAEPTLGTLWELEAIAAAAIGGASLMGGKGSIFGTILGAIVLGAMRNGLTLLNVQAFYQLLATGIIIILAMLVDRLARGKG